MIEAILILQIIIIAAIVFTARKAIWAFRAADSLRQHTHHIGEQTTQQLEHLDRLYLRLGLPRGSLPPTRGWAASPDFLNILYEHLTANQPRTIIEFGSGLTTIVTARALQQLGGGRLLSIDHDAYFAGLTRDTLHQLGLQDFADIQVAPLAPQKIDGAERLWYDLSKIAIPDAIELITVDGPPEPLTGAEGRYPVGPVLFDRIVTGGAVLFDDASRPGEKIFIEKLLNRFPHFRRDDIQAEKGCTKLTRIQTAGR